MSWQARFSLLTASLWWGSLTAIGFIAVPVLFSNLPATIAGRLAAHLFTAQTWTSVACGMIVLIASRSEKASKDWDDNVVGFAITALLLALIGEFAISPRIVATQGAAVWHVAGQAGYAVQWFCVLVVLRKVSSRP